MPQKTGVGVTEEKTAAAKAAPQKDKKTARSASAKPDGYGDESITSLKGADRVRKRPGVIFGSDGLEGCEHSFFEILSNAVDEAREGHGSVIKVTYFRDLKASRWTTAGAVCRWAGTNAKDAGTGISSTVSCTPAENTTTTATVPHTSTRWD